MMHIQYIHYTQTMEWVTKCCKINKNQAKLGAWSLINVIEAFGFPKLRNFPLKFVKTFYLNFSEMSVIDYLNNCKTKLHWKTTKNVEKRARLFSVFTQYSNLQILHCCEYNIDPLLKLLQHFPYPQHLVTSNLFKYYFKMCKFSSKRKYLTRKANLKNKNKYICGSYSFTEIRMVILFVCVNASIRRGHFVVWYKAFW